MAIKPRDGEQLYDYDAQESAATKGGAWRTAGLAEQNGNLQKTIYGLGGQTADHYGSNMYKNDYGAMINSGMAMGMTPGMIAAADVFKLGKAATDTSLTKYQNDGIHQAAQDYIQNNGFNYNDNYGYRGVIGSMGVNQPMAVNNAVAQQMNTMTPTLPSTQFGTTGAKPSNKGGLATPINGAVSAIKPMVGSGTMGGLPATEAKPSNIPAGNLTNGAKPKKGSVNSGHGNNPVEEYANAKYEDPNRFNTVNGLTGAVGDALKQYVNSTYSNYLNSPEYSALADKYTTAGQAAMQNTLGTAAAQTGGIASSYASSAAAQAYNNYMTQLSDAAQSAYQNDLENQRNKINSMIGERNDIHGIDQDMWSRDFDTYKWNGDNALNWYDRYDDNAKWTASLDSDNYWKGQNLGFDYTNLYTGDDTTRRGQDYDYKIAQENNAAKINAANISASASIEKQNIANAGDMAELAFKYQNGMYSGANSGSSGSGGADFDKMFKTLTGAPNYYTPDEALAWMKKNGYV